MIKQLKNQIRLHETNFNLQRSLLSKHSQDVGNKTQTLLSAPSTLAAIFCVSFIVGISKKTHPKQVASFAERLSTAFTFYRIWQKFSNRHA